MLIIDEMSAAPMKSLEAQMAAYAAYHQDARNKATHFIGVPAIALSLFVPLAWARFELGGVMVSAAMLLMAIFVLYYLVLDVALGVAMLVAFSILLWAGERIAGLGAVAGWSAFAALFIGGWIFQLVGHVFEGRRPALVDNLFQSVFIAPIFLAAEVFFALGYKPGLQEAVQRRAMKMRASA